MVFVRAVSTVRSFSSVRNVSMGSCAPVRITGFLRFCSRKDRAEAVYAMVSAFYHAYGSACINE